jgi:hypothetical protein
MRTCSAISKKHQIQVKKILKRASGITKEMLDDLRQTAIRIHDQAEEKIC